MNSTAMWSLTAALAATLFPATAPSARAAEPAPAAIAGEVSSAAQGGMEGVVVTAHNNGSIVSVSVITDAKGHYAFPESRLEPGHYTLAIRAVGYDLSAPAATDVVSERTSNVDLKLVPTKDLPDQLTDAEWMMSIPGTDDQKAALLNCTSCHTLERIVLSTHNVDEWMQVVHRMMGYGAVSQPVKPQPMLDRAGKPEQYRKLAEYLATINLSAVDKWTYPLKTLPRPSGDSTHVIVTEYSLPRPTIEPHDIVLDKDGNVWYTDFGEMFVSKFDPKTLKLTEYPIKTFKPDAPVGLLSLAFDKEGMLWFDTMYQGSLGSIDPATGATKYYPLPAKWNDKRVQLNFVGLRHDVDGKVWTKDVGTGYIYRLDLATGDWQRLHPTDLLPDAQHHHYGVYQVISDAQNNLWMAEFSEGYLGKIDAKTLKVTWYTPPTVHARLRRMELEPNGDIVVTEYRGNKVAVFDPKTEKFTEYQLPPYTYPYRANFDKNGDIWASTMSTDRVVRMNPKTGQSDQYLMPSDTNMRTVYVDNSTNPVGFWVGSNHDHALVHVEPLD